MRPRGEQQLDQLARRYAANVQQGGLHYLAKLDFHREYGVSKFERCLRVAHGIIGEPFPLLSVVPHLPDCQLVDLYFVLPHYLRVGIAEREIVDFERSDDSEEADYRVQINVQPAYDSRAVVHAPSRRLEIRAVAPEREPDPVRFGPRLQVRKIERCGIVAKKKLRVGGFHDLDELLERGLLVRGRFLESPAGRPIRYYAAALPAFPLAPSGASSPTPLSSFPPAPAIAGIAYHYDGVFLLPRHALRVIRLDVEREGFEIEGRIPGNTHVFRGLSLLLELNPHERRKSPVNHVPSGKRNPVLVRLAELLNFLPDDHDVARMRAGYS